MSKELKTTDEVTNPHASYWTHLEPADYTGNDRTAFALMPVSIVFREERFNT